MRPELEKVLKKIIITSAIGLPAVIAFTYYTSWQATLALFFILWADNIDKRKG
jgi:hypothetical protein